MLQKKKIKLLYTYIFIVTGTFPDNEMLKFYDTANKNE